MIVGNMGVLLVSDGTAAVQPRMNLNAVKAAGAQRAIDIANETNNNVNGLRDANDLMPTQVVGIIDVVVNDEPVRSWMPPPPKKKWIRHYLLGEPNFYPSTLPFLVCLSLSNRTPWIFSRSTDRSFFRVKFHRVQIGQFDIERTSEPLTIVVHLGEIYSVRPPN